MMPKNAKITDYKQQDHTIYPGLRVIQKEYNDERGYKQIRGIVEHKLGMVEFFQYQQWPTYEWGANYLHDLQLSLIHNGHKYTRYWNAWYGKKTIAMLANRFIEEVING